jgi:hypothetical protein
MGVALSYSLGDHRSAQDGTFVQELIQYNTCFWRHILELRMYGCDGLFLNSVTNAPVVSSVAHRRSCGQSRRSHQSSVKKYLSHKHRLTRHARAVLADLVGNLYQTVRVSRSDGVGHHDEVRSSNRIIRVQCANAPIPLVCERWSKARARPSRIPGGRLSIGGGRVPSPLKVC